MSLKEQLQEKKMSIYAFAKKVGCTYVSAYGWVNKGVIPSPVYQKMIDKVLQAK